MTTVAPLKPWGRKELTGVEIPRFRNEYEHVRSSMYEHYARSAHRVMGYSDNFDGFVAYAREMLKVDITDQTIRNQITAGQVSAAVGEAVPMRIANEIAKLEDPRRQQEAFKELKAREEAGVRTVDQMTSDARKVVGRMLGPVTKDAPPASPAPRTEAEAPKVDKAPPEAPAPRTEANTSKEPRPSLWVAADLLKEWTKTYMESLAQEEVHAKTAAWIKAYDRAVK